MSQTKKLVCGTQRALDKEIEAHKARGWAVERTESVARGQRTARSTHIAYLKKESAWTPKKHSSSSKQSGYS